MATGPLLTLKSGYAAYRKYDSSGSLGTTIYPIQATAQSLQPYNLNITTTDVPNGNSPWPLTVVETGIEAGANITFSDFDPKAFSDLTGSTYTESGSETMYFRQKETIPDSGYTVTLDHTPLDSPVPTVCSLDGSPWVKVASNPAEDQFSVSGSVATFNSANAGDEIYVFGAYTEATATSVGTPSNVKMPTLQFIVVNENTPSNRVRNDFDVTVILDKVRATGNIGLPEGSSNPANWTLALRVLEPRAGQSVGKMVYKQRS